MSECWKILSTGVTGFGRGAVKCFRTTPSSAAGCESGIRHIFPLTAKYMWQPRGEGRCLALHWTTDRQTDRQLTLETIFSLSVAPNGSPEGHEWEGRMRECDKELGNQRAR